LLYILILDVWLFRLIINIYDSRITFKTQLLISLLMERPLKTTINCDLGKISLFYCQKKVGEGLFRHDVID